MARKIEVYHVERSVPVPVEVRSPLAILEVGESFAFPLEKRSSIQTTASKIKREQGWEFKVKKMNDNEARVWRVK